jgi:hypothetical protein
MARLPLWYLGQALKPSALLSRLVLARSPFLAVALKPSRLLSR